MLRKIKLTVKKLFSPALKDKIKLILLILKSDYRIAQINPRRCYDFDNYSESIIDDVFAELDEESRDVARTFLRLKHQLSEERYLTLYNKNTSRRIRRLEHRIVNEIIDLQESTNGLFTCPESCTLYYHNGLRLLSDSVLQYIKNTAFIDGGAASGDSCFMFQKYDPAIVYSFEPSLLNQKDFLTNMNTLHVPAEKYQVVPCGLAASKSTICFNDTGTAENSLLEEGDTSVDLVSLDDFAEAEIKIRVGFIKADLEGMGLQMLQGAEKTIRKYKPVLSLSIYHNSDEFFDIYKTLKSWNLGYRFKIVTLEPSSSGEVTLLAMPKDCFESAE